MSTGRRILESYLDWSFTGLKPAVFEGALQLVVGLGLAVILNKLLFERRVSSPPLYWIVTLLAFFASLQIPVHELQLSRPVRGLVFLLCCIGLVSLPSVLSFYLWPSEGVRRTISVFLYLTIFGLITADFLKS